jgi:hypothetical protein
MVKSISAAAACAVVTALALGGAARGAAEKRDNKTPATTTPVAAKSTAATDDKSAGFLVDGFRSAKFGMNEADIRAAMAKDFGTKPEAIKPQENAAELTHSLVASVPDLLNGGGTAEVSYVLGYKSKTLIQVGAVWSKAVDPAITPERLFSNANILRAHFLGEGFKPETVAVNTPVAGGLLIFRGSDANDRQVVLLLQGTFENRDNNQRVLTPMALLLFYIADAKSPDVFRLPPGQF